MEIDGDYRKALRMNVAGSSIGAPFPYFFLFIYLSLLLLFLLLLLLLLLMLYHVCCLIVVFGGSFLALDHRVGEYSAFRLLVA